MRISFQTTNGILSNSLIPMQLVAYKLLNKVWLVNREIVTEDFKKAVENINYVASSGLPFELDEKQTHAYIRTQAHEDTEVLNIHDAT